MYLLYTNVVSELRKSRNRANANVLVWVHSVNVATLYLSPITLMELEMGVLRLKRHDHAQAALLRDWLDDFVVPTFQDSHPSN